MDEKNKVGRPHREWVDDNEKICYRASEPHAMRQGGVRLQRARSPRLIIMMLMMMIKTLLMIILVHIIATRSDSASTQLNKIVEILQVSTESEKN